MLLYCGIDEAGYGPRLGPLCVAGVMLEVSDWTEGEHAPDLWTALRPVVGRTLSDARGGRIAVNDSKSLKLANSLKSAHPLTHLERGVLAFLGAAGAEPTTDRELLEHLGADLSDECWYEGPAAELPLSTTPDHRSLAAARLRGACEKAGVRVRAIRCGALGASRFNERLGNAGSKADVNFSIVADHLRVVWEQAPGTPHPPRVVVDRQGGRTNYAPLLGRLFPDARTTVRARSPAMSCYDVEGSDRAMRVVFMPDAESSHFPVALASMTAKLVREIAMMRFNRYWCDRIAGLKPTAGYSTDAGRWLRDAGGALSPSVREQLVRRA